MIVGVDFGAPRRAREQRRKTVAIAARIMGPRAYRIDSSGMNARLMARRAPGWSAAELAGELLDRPARVVGFDFPFSVPEALLLDGAFAASAGHAAGAFGTWRSFNRFVTHRLPLRDPLDFSPFAAWRDPADRARLWTKRDTDLAAGAQPPLKDLFQATFQMTLLGNAVLGRLVESHKYRVVPFPGGRGEGELIEVYPRATLRRLGLVGYKAHPLDSVKLGMAACAHWGISLEVDDRLLHACVRYSSGGKTPDHDAADAFVALCTAILYAEGACHPAGGASHASEGAIWVPLPAPVTPSGAA